MSICRDLPVAWPSKFDNIAAVFSFFALPIQTARTTHSVILVDTSSIQ